MLRSKMWWMFLAFGLVVLLTSGCSRVVGPTPQEVARQWYEAVGAFDTVRMYELTHPELRTGLEASLKRPEITVAAALGLQKLKYFDMHYEVMQQDGQAAQVAVAGKVANRLGGIDTVNETIELRKTNGHWYIWMAAGWLQ
jgi:hypothetical protein